jgi:hypothetical protein
MGMTTHIIGLKSKDSEEYAKHSCVLKACHTAGVKKLPQETADFFDSELVDITLLNEILEVSIPHNLYVGDMEEGYEVIVSDIPKDVHKIRFYNSY